MSEYGIYGVGLLAQLLFSARLIVQLVKSERAGRVLSPTLFWQLSLIASFLLMAYGILRDDLVIILGQALSYFIYIRNLQYKHAWTQIPSYFKVSVLAFPVAAIAWLTSGSIHNWQDVIHNPTISGGMLTWGSIGQFIFTSRFIYQWYYAEKVRRSVLPEGFWVISIIGAVLVTIYGLYRHDPILIFGQVFGLVIYVRNLRIGINNRTSASVCHYEQVR